LRQPGRRHRWEHLRRDFELLMDALGRAHEQSIVTLIPLSSDARFTQEIEAANAAIREVAIRHGAAVIDLNSFIAADGLSRNLLNC
jgi:hypothetical protein